MAKCEMCGQSISMMAFPRWYVKIDGVKHEVCKNCNAQAVSTGRGFKLDSQSGKLVFVSAEDMEVRNKCAVCGHIYCYSKYDVKRNEELLKSAKLSAMGGMAGDSTQLGNAQRQINAMVDYTKCPKCGSRDVRTLTKEEYQLELQAAQTQQSGASTASAADELKKFKELLDSGIITQEEFDAKKKQLLGL